MKRSFALVIIIVCLGGCLRAQESDEISRTVFKLSPQHFLFNSLKAGLERFNKNHTGSIAFFLTGMIDNKVYTYDGGGYTGLAGEVQLRRYISPMKRYTAKNDKGYYRGIYGAAYFQGGSYSGSFEGDYGHFDASGKYLPQYYKYDESVANYGFGVTIGYQRTFWQVIFVDAFIGGGIQLRDLTQTGQLPDRGYYDYTGITYPDYKGALPKIGILIGLGL